jgi:hypothetical protein
VNAAEIKLLEGDNDPDLEAKAAHNAAMVNDRVLLRLETEVKNGTFAIELPQPLSPDIRIIRAHAVGVDPSDKAFNAIAALRIGS